MIYFDSGATSLQKPASVREAVATALMTMASPGRGGYPASMAAADAVFRARQTAGRLFNAAPDQVVFTTNATHGLNLAIHSIVKPGSTVVVSGFEHNAVVRPLYARNCKIIFAGRTLFDQDATLREFEQALKGGAEAAVCNHVSNVFGFIQPIEEIAELCRSYKVPFIIDAAQSAGILPLDLKKLGAAFIAMPGHKSLLGPQGTGILLCSGKTEPMLYGGTGMLAVEHEMPDMLPERLEAGTVNVPGICGLGAGMEYLESVGIDKIARHEALLAKMAAAGLSTIPGVTVYTGPHQAGVVSFRAQKDCESIAGSLAEQGIAVRAGMHCAPIAHESAGTLDTGTVRVSFSPFNTPDQCRALIPAVRRAISEASG